MDDSALPPVQSSAVRTDDSPASSRRDDDRTGAADAKQCPQCGARFPQNFRVCPHDATPLVDAAEADDPLIGQILDGTYEIVSVLGEGGMGRVYEARHSRLRTKRFAVKVLHPELARQPEVIARFQREAEAVSSLLHPNVVAVHDVNTTSAGYPYIVAELLSGEQLGSRLARVGKLESAEAVTLAKQICRALRAAHEHGIVHRDVKPENVFLAGEDRGSAEPTVKVLDFGISKVAESSAALTKTGMVMGTPDYMAPEQARGDRVDERADIYAVGAILYRALTGVKPFEGRDEMGVLTAVLVEEPPRPSSLQAAISPSLELIVQRAMAKDPKERYQTMAELERDLVEFESVAIRPASTTTPGAERPSFLAEVLSATRLSDAARRARAARPLLVLLTALSALWLFAGIADAAQSVIRIVASRPRPLSGTEVTLIFLGALAALATPAVLWIKHLARGVWGSTPRAIGYVSRISLALFASAAAYGLVALAVHFCEAFYARAPRGAAGPEANLALFVIAAGVGALAWAWAARCGGRAKASS